MLNDFIIWIKFYYKLSPFFNSIEIIRDAIYIIIFFFLPPIFYFFKKKELKLAKNLSFFIFFTPLFYTLYIWIFLIPIIWFFHILIYFFISSPIYFPYLNNFYIPSKKKNIFSFINFISSKKIIYLDSAGTSLKLKKMVEYTNNYYKEMSINVHSNSKNFLYDKVFKNIEETRKIISLLINAEKNEIIFTPSTTYSINILSLSLMKYIGKNKKIILNKLNHSSNIFPWINIAKKNFLFFDLDNNFSIDIDKIEEKINDSVCLASFSYTNNTLGINNVKKITELIKKKNPNCLVLVDVSQNISYSKIDVKEWNIDFLVFSGHKTFGPTGIGVLWINSKIEKFFSDVFYGGGKKSYPKNFEYGNYLLKIIGEEDITKRIEIGTLPIAQIIGLKACFEFINFISFKKKRKFLDYERKIILHAYNYISKIEDIIIYSSLENSLSSNIILINIKGINSQDLANYLGKNNIIVRSGDFCCPYFNEILKVSSAVRISFSIYNWIKDVNYLIYYLKKVSMNKKKIIINSLF